MRFVRWLAKVALVVLALGRAGVASADPRAERADQLFSEGKALMESNLQQACAKFKESLDYNPAAIGTLLNFALCEEKLGQIATAVDKFTEARNHAKEQGLAEHARAAEQHIAALTPDLPHVSLTLAETLPDTRILINDHLVATSALTQIAVDPGECEVVVNAPDRLPYRTRFVIRKAEHQDIAIPALARSVTIRSSRRRIGQLITAVGVAAAGTGVGIGLYANHLYNAQFGHQQPGDGLCGNDNRCEHDGLTRTQRARTLGNVGTVIGVAGAVTAMVGAYLWWRSPSAVTHDTSDRGIAVVPGLTGDALGVTATGRF